MSTSTCPRCGSFLVDARCARCDGAAAPGEALEEATLAPGEVLAGKWRVEGLVGRGGMGTVYAARDLALDRRVAIKLLRESLTHDAEGVARFEIEARAAARMSHPNVVPVYEVGRYGSQPFMVMKFLKGENLDALLARDGPLSASRTLHLLRQVCDGLEHLHAQGFVHRDVKAANVSVSADGHATLLDFGLLRERAVAGPTRIGTAVGTPTHMAPEQAMGAEVDLRADLYAVGVLVFECLTGGRTPFEARSPSATMLAHAQEAPPDLRALQPDLPEALTGFMVRALAKSPDDRFQSARDLLAALEAVLAAPAPPPNPLDFEPAGGPPIPSPPPAAPPEAPAPLRRWPWLALAAGLFGAAAAWWLASAR